MIGQSTIDRVRDRTSITKLIGESVKLERRGRSHVGLCPFHQEKTPSFHVSEERGFYHCFGCSASGDVFRFCQEVLGQSFVEAVRFLAERGGIEIEEEEREAPEERERKRKRQELYDLNSTAARYFEAMLREHPLRQHALQELEKRGLSPEGPEPTRKALSAFRLGYAPYGWEGLAQHLKKVGCNLSSAEALGLVVPRQKGSTFYDRFRHRLMFAILDLQGNVVGFSGRALPNPTAAELEATGLASALEPGREAPAKYVNSPESPIYKKREVVFGLYQARDGIRRRDSCLLVEGNFDVVSLHAKGHDNAVAPLGTAFTADQARQLRRFAPSVTLLFDGDDAGRRAIKAAREPTAEAGLEVRVALLPTGTDPDDFVRSRGAEALSSLVGAASGLLEYLINTALDFSSTDIRVRAEKVKEVLELMRAEKDPTVRSLAERHADRIAERLGIADAKTFRALAARIRSDLTRPSGQPQPPRATSAQAGPPSTARSRDQRAELGAQILGALLDFPELLGSAELREGAGLLEGDIAMAVAALQRQQVAGPTRGVEQVLANLPASIHPFALARLAAPRHDRLEDARAELVGNMEKLERLELVRQTTETVEELERAAQSGDFDQELKLLAKQVQRARVRHGLTER